MLLLWYTPPKQTARALPALRRRQARDYIEQEDTLMILLLYWQLNQLKEIKENG